MVRAAMKVKGGGVFEIGAASQGFSIIFSALEALIVLLPRKSLDSLISFP